MAALDSPFLWIEVVGTVAEVLCKAYRMSLVSKQNDTVRCLIWQCDSLVPEVGDCRRIIDFNLWVSRFVGREGECQCVVGNEGLALQCPLLYATG